MNGLDLIYAIEKVTGRGTIEGAQKMGNLFRIYVKDESSKHKLSIEGFIFHGHQVSLYSHNPYTVKEQSAETVKIIIGGVPLSVAHEEFEKALLDLNVEMVSDIKFENYRDGDGKWTNYKTGRRFVYCQKPALNLKPFTKIGLWNATIYYRGQIRPKSQNQTNPKQVGTKEDKQNEPVVVKQANYATNTPIPPSVSPHETEKNDGKNMPSVNTTELGVPIETNVIVSKHSKDTSSIGKGQVNQKEKVNATPLTMKNNPSDTVKQDRGRSHLRKGITDLKQKNLTKMFNRQSSTSSQRSKRGHETSPQSPLPPKSNTRSKSRQTDWFDATGDDPGLC